jgi:hypothetical protein
MEQTIRNLGEEVKQLSNPYINLSKCSMWWCQVNALKAMVPNFDLDEEKEI